MMLSWKNEVGLLDRKTGLRWIKSADPGGEAINTEDLLIVKVRSQLLPHTPHGRR